MMIITGVFLFLLGTKLGHASKTEVKYEGPSKITVSEEKDDSVILPGLGSPPYAPSFFHQGSNFFFNPQFVHSDGYFPYEIEKASFLQQKYSKNISVVTPEVSSDIIIEKEPLIEEIVSGQSVILQSEIKESIERIPQEQVEMKPVPIEILQNPSVEVLEEPSFVPEPCVDVEISNPVGSFMPSNVPILIEEPQTSDGLIITEFDVPIKNIPPPPELPPLILSEIPKPLYDVNKRVVLIPSAPQLGSFLPPPVMVAEKPIIPMDCAQNIVFERVLPHIAFEKGKIVELISIPASKRAPVVSSIVY